MNNVLAAFIFFTRLPFWRIKEVPAESFKRVVDYWPMVGWLTGGLTAAVLWITGNVFPLEVAVVLAILFRILLTGALHEDGLADFLDGFGGGKTKVQTLLIMKDSHIGSYGVIGLILYFLLLGLLLSSLNLVTACAVLFAGDVWSKFVAGQMVNLLPYARKVEESKNKTIYERMSPAAILLALVIGVIPLAILLTPALWAAAIFPILVLALLCRLMKKRIQGYTGDCCGAMFLLCELSFYLGVVLLIHNNFTII